MLRLLSRLHVQIQLSLTHQRQAKIYSGQKFLERKRYGEVDKNHNHKLSAYFLASDRHQMFRKESDQIYQFDNETHNVFTWMNTKQISNCDWNCSTTNYTDEEMINAFENLLNYCKTNAISLSDTRFDRFIDEFTHRLQHFSLNNVIHALQCYARQANFNLHHVRQRNFIELFQAFDQVCTIKSQDLLSDQLLLISSIWLTIPFGRRSFFAQLMARLFNRYIKTMTASQMALALFFINAMQQKVFDIRAFENVFEEKMDELTTEEFATVLWTFIRLETKLEKQELRDKFFNYLEKQDLSRLSDSMLTKILLVNIGIH